MAFDPTERPRVIMLVDDEPSVLSALARAIRIHYRDCPVTVETFERPALALARARLAPFSLVVSDMSMPEMDGCAFLKAFRAIQPKTPRVLLSAHTDFGQLAQAINDGGICLFQQKPWVDALLIGAMEAAMDAAEGLAENERKADQNRVVDGELSSAEEALRRLGEKHPALAHVRTAPDGSVLLDHFD